MTSPAQTFELAMQYHRAGYLHQAEQLYRQILERDPRNADALHLFGVIALQVGKHETAVEYIQQALRVRHDIPEAHNNLGTAQASLGRLEQAAASFQQAARLKPDYAEAYYNLGTALSAQGKLAEAVASYAQAVRLKPDYADAYNNLGLALKDQGKLDDAVASFQQALHYRPDFAEAYNNRGLVLRAQGKSDEAITSHQQALRLQPAQASAHFNLGNALVDQGKTEEAIACFQQALALKPDYADAFNNLGCALQDRGRLDEAIACYRQAVTRKPDDAEAHSNLGNALKDVGKIDEAVAEYRRALSLRPDASHIHSHLLLSMNCDPGCDAAALRDEARRWNDRHAEPLAKFHRPHANIRDPGRRLRIGYVSPDFRVHPVANFLMPLLVNHDHGQVEVFCYAEVARPDDMTRRLRGCADGWRDTVGLDDERLAELVRGDQIDILVDLALHTDRNRLLVFARKPAPVQVSWLGYPGSTGLSAIDYFVTDPYLDARDTGDAGFADRAICLPETSGCYDPLCGEVEVHALPALQNGFITFGCLNNFCKINAINLSTWASVLRALPGSRLLLRAPRGLAQTGVLAQLARDGIDESRVEFDARHATKEQYLQTYRRIDVCLDPWPCNGGVTSLDALWMGVPIVALAGKTAVSRAGWSYLCNLNLRDLAAETPNEYAGLAIRLAQDQPRLQELRATLRGRLRASPLMDGRRFARHMEKAYRQMWKKWMGSSQ